MGFNSGFKGLKDSTGTGLNLSRTRTRDTEIVSREPIRYVAMKLACLQAWTYSVVRSLKRKAISLGSSVLRTASQYLRLFVGPASFPGTSSFVCVPNDSVSAKDFHTNPTLHWLRTYGRMSYMSSKTCSSYSFVIIIYINTVNYVCNIMIYWSTERIFSRYAFLDSLWFDIFGNLLLFLLILSQNIFF